MANKQQRNNKEKKKPKAAKAAPAQVASAKGKFSPQNLPGAKKPW